MFEHSKKFEVVKKYYDTGNWGKKAVRNAVIKSWITYQEYEEITKEPYHWNNHGGLDEKNT